MNKKPLKVEEDAGTYLVAKPAKKKRSSVKGPNAVVPGTKKSPHAVLSKARPLFTGRDWSKLPSSPVDSTIFISEDRDGR